MSALLELITVTPMQIARILQAVLPAFVNRDTLVMDSRVKVTKQVFLLP